MKIFQIAVLVSSFLLFSTSREKQPVAGMLVKERSNRQLDSETSPEIVQNLIEDTSNEMSLLALNVLKGSHSDGTENPEKKTSAPVKPETDDDFQNVPPVDTFWLQNLKMSLRQ